MNERDGYFCAMTSRRPDGRGPRRLATTAAARPTGRGRSTGSSARQGVTFSGYFEDRSQLVDITTDHPVVVSQVRIVGEKGVKYDAGG